MANDLTYAGILIQHRHDMLSLTDMWKAAGSDPSRRPAEWLRSADAVRFIGFVSETLSVGIPHTDLVKATVGGRDPSTFAHWQIGLAYAKYLSPEFHVWCNTVVRERMEWRASTGHNGVTAQHAATAFEAYFGVGKLIGLDVNQSALAAGRAARVATGEDPLATMGITHLLAPQQEVLLTATDIGKRLGDKSAIAVNQLLQERGFQIGLRDLKERTYWEPTEAGKAYAVVLDTAKKHSDGTPVRQVKWVASIVDVLATDCSALTAELPHQS